MSHLAVLVVSSLGEGEGGGVVVLGESQEVGRLVQPGRDGDLDPLAGLGLSLSHQGRHSVAAIKRDEASRGFVLICISQI